MTKQWQVAYSSGRLRKEFYARAAADVFAAEHGSVVEPITRARGFQLRTIVRVSGKPVQVIPAMDRSW